MMREIIQEARSVDEAIDEACRQLGVERDIIEFEIINLPKRGFLGLRNTPAKVRVYVEEKDPPKVEKREERRSVSKKEEKIGNQEPQQKPLKQRESRRPQEQAEAPKAEKKEKVVPPVEEEPMKLEFVSADQVEGKAKTATEYLKSVLNEMGVNADISVAFTENGMVLRLSGEGLGVIIGRRGETLDALQYLSGLVANREEGDYMRVTIDSGNYREKRERTLEQLAQKLSASAIRYGRSSTLEPMNPYERRIIHAAVSKIEGVTSTSIGEEPNRRVVISPTNPRPQNRNNRGGRGGRSGSRPPRRNDNRSNDRRNDRGPRRDNRDGAPRRDRPMASAQATTPTNIDREYAREIEREAPAYVKPDPSEQKPVQREIATQTRTQTKKEGEDLPLYGKIEL